MQLWCRQKIWVGKNVGYPPPPGEIKEVEEVWKKWQGKEASMFMALASKYKDPFHAQVLLS